MEAGPFRRTFEDSPIENDLATDVNATADSSPSGSANTFPSIGELFRRSRLSASGFGPEAVYGRPCLSYQRAFMTKRL